MRLGIILSFLILAFSFAACGGSVTNQGVASNCTVCGGSCVDVKTDANNCGACGTKCAAGQVCGNGACAAACPDGQTACDGKCADTSTDPGNCGACGTKCSAPNAAQACSAGKCTYGSCKAGFADCDGDATNGCEKPVSTDIANCGGCGVTCAPVHASGAACAAGKCGYDKCDATFADCDGNKANGCEANTSIDADNCGGCGIKCTNGATCVSGGCASVPPVQGATSYAYPTDGNGTVTSPTTFFVMIQSVQPAVIFYTTDGSTPTYASPYAQSPLTLTITDTNAPKSTTVKWFTSVDPTVQTHIAIIDPTRQTCYGGNDFAQHLRWDATGGPVVTASPGQVLTGQIDYRTWRTSCIYCPGCVRYPSYGIAKTQGCYPNNPYNSWPGDARTDLKISVTAPTVPGVYHLGRNVQLDYSCYLGRGVGGDDGTIIVQ